MSDSRTYKVYTKHRWFLGEVWASSPKAAVEHFKMRGFAADHAI